MPGRVKKNLGIIIIIMRHWWFMLPLMSIILYTVVISCEKNILAFFKDIWLAERNFWRIADISYIVYMCILIILILIPILHKHIYQIIKSAGCSMMMISIVISILQIIMYLPAFVWYCSIYSDAVYHIIREIIISLIIQNVCIILMKKLRRDS